MPQNEYLNISAEELAELDDEELVKHCLRYGDSDDRPFRELFHRYRYFVWRISLGFMKNNPAEAEDLTQDVFLKIYRNLASFDSRASLKTWIYRITVNNSLNELRRISSKPARDAASLDHIPEKKSPDPSPEQCCHQKMQHEKLYHVIDNLKPREREILYLKDIYDLPYIEVAEILNISVSAAKMRVLRARLALQRLYADTYTGEVADE